MIKIIENYTAVYISDTKITICKGWKILKIFAWEKRKLQTVEIKK